MATKRTVTKIPATLAKFGSMPLFEEKKRRVAAYARVSTDEDEQLNSYEAQVRYYTEYISGRSDWEFVGVYSDEGVTGTHTNRRVGFKRMVDDAIKNRKIDLILTKSMSRFARNTVDSLTTIRDLKDHGVEVYFEKENIWTFDSKGELLISIMSSLAQEESRSISENVQWGLHKRYEEGKYSVGYSSFLGYDKGSDGKFVINQEQAKTVRFIFRSYLEGKTPYTISCKLMEMGAKTGTGSTRWSSNAVIRILQNEKYAGNASLQKSYKPDLLSKRIENKGEVERYFVQNGHEAIIPQEDYDMVQREMEVRAMEKLKSTSKSIYSGKVFCGKCDMYFGSKVWHSTSQFRTVVWQCNAKFKKRGHKGCMTPHLREPDIQKIFLLAVNRLVVNRNSVVTRLEGVVSRLKDTSALEVKLSATKTELELAVAAFNAFVSSSSLTEEMLANGKYAELQEKVESWKKKVDALNDEMIDRRRRALEILRFIEDLKGCDVLFPKFTEELWFGLCDRITVMENGESVVRFRSGMEIPVEYDSKK